MLHIYKASAGSGKTFALARRYLQLILGRLDKNSGKWYLNKKPAAAHRHILAITFTNKATEEMTRRIIKELAVIAGREPGHDRPSPYIEYFTKLFRCSPQELKELASRQLDDMLADYAFFHVSTIDAFFQTVLRTFAREIEMPDNFELELNDNSTIAIGVNRMFTSINMREPVDPVMKREYRWLRTWLQNYMESMFDNGKAINIFSRRSSIYGELVSTFTRLIDENFKINAREITGYLADIDRLVAFERGLKSRQAALGEQLRREATNLTHMGDFPNLNNHLRNFVTNCAAGIFKTPSATVVKSIGDQSKRYMAAYLRRGDIPPELDALAIDVPQLGITYSELARRNESILRSISSFGLLGCLLRYINDYCKDNNLILLSETNTLLRRIINDDDTPFVYERLGYYLHNFLIDEFQDTSRMQWENLRPLVMESLSNQNEDLIIGDEKQCIYRFRNSDPELLGSVIGAETAEVFGNESVAVEGMTIAENNNWRSSAEVVKFNNSIFHSLALGIGDTSTYSNVIQQISPHRSSDIPGYVKMIFQERPSKDKGSAETSAEAGRDNIGSEVDTKNSSDADDKYAFGLERMVEEVDRMLSAGYSQSDITILVRTHREGERVIKTLLGCNAGEGWRHGPLQVTSSDAVAISSSPAVGLVVDILRITQTPQIVERERIKRDGTTERVEEENPAYRRARLLYNYEYFLHRDIMLPDGTSRRSTPEEAIIRAVEAVAEDDAKAASDIDMMHSLLRFDRSDDDARQGRFSCVTLSSVVDRIISQFVSKEALERETLFLTSFQDLVYDFCSRGNSDIRSFLEWWDRSGRNRGISQTEESASINVMTVHQSKGLEFPCVIIPFANWDLVTYSTPMQPAYQWFALNPADFPEVAPEIVPPMLPLEFKENLSDHPIFAEQNKIYCRQQRIDALNVAYVALTRAVNELVVIVPVKKRESDDSLGVALANAVDRLTSDFIASDSTLDDGSRKWVLPLADMYREDNTIEIGTPISAPERKREAKQTMELPAYDGRINERLVAMSIDDIEMFDFDNPRHRGDFLHGVMSKVRHRSQLPLALKRAAYRARLTPEQYRSCSEILERALADKRVKQWFEGYKRVVTERTVVSDDKTDRRPDRVVWLPDGHIDIIDYKFGEMRPSYRRQMRLYLRLLSEAGYTGLRAFLWFPESGEILRIHP